MQVTLDIVNAFIDLSSSAPDSQMNTSNSPVLGGNPAGVVLDADRFDSAQKLAIARAAGLSETAFVSRSTVADYKLDFFTPSRQIAHCGHATVAVFSFLSKMGHLADGDYSKETIDGNRKIVVADGAAYMEQLAPKYELVDHIQQKILDSLGLTQGQLIGNAMVVNTGNSFLIVGVDSLETLSSIKPELSKINEISESLDLIGYYVFSQQVHQEGADVTTRMFAPRYGIDEEAATGMAAGPMACYLHDQMQLEKDIYKIEQGFVMQPQASQSLINVELYRENGEIRSLMAGGIAELSGKIQVDI